MSINSNSHNGRGRIRVSQFTASGTWTAPAGVFAVNILGVGGGGAGGGAKGNLQPSAYGGGGGGGGVFDGIVPVVPGTTYTVTIGSGGVSATAANLPTGNGGDTSFGSLITCPGGQAGVSIAAASTTAATAISRTNNPGGSFGGFALWENSNNVPFTQGSHGGGAGSPAEFAYIYSEFTSTSSLRGTNMIADYNNGFGIIGLPYAAIDTSLVSSWGFAANSVSIFLGTQTSVTNLAYIKRNRAQSILFGFSISRPGISWKGLGAGGAGATPPRQAKGGNVYAGEFQLVDINAGYNAGFGVETGGFSGGNNYAGTSASANSGAGGGGAISVDTTNMAAGNGGSGYLEITWEE